MTEIVSKPFRPDQCCEACAFGRGQHADWCLRERNIDIANEQFYRLNPSGIRASAFGPIPETTHGLPS